MPFSLPFLSLGPRIQVEAQTVTMRTGFLVATLTLGSWLDHVVVDSRRKEVTITRRRLWAFANTRAIRFDQIQHIAYSVIDTGSAIGDQRGTAETFDVALSLYSMEEVPLVRFSGDGEYVVDVSSPFHYFQDRFDEITDVRGQQQERSLGLVDLLSLRIGVPLGPSRYF